MSFDAAAECRFLQNFARETHAAHGIPLDHLRNRVGAQKYVDIVRDTTRHFSAGRILDWGCGFGQTTYLLKKAGLDVQSYDLVKRQGAGWQALHEHMGNQPIYNNDPVKLPFPDASFDAVMSCGVLEHVPDETGSLAEIHRVLRPRGWFFVFMLPNRWSYTETIATWRGKSDHPVKYTRRGIRESLDRAGYEIVSRHYSNMIPKNLTGLPRGLNRVYDALFYPLHWLDHALCAIPGINTISGVHSIAARRKSE